MLKMNLGEVLAQLVKAGDDVDILRLVLEDVERLLREVDLERGVLLGLQENIGERLAALAERREAVATPKKRRGRPRKVLGGGSLPGLGENAPDAEDPDGE